MASIAALAPRKSVRRLWFNLCSLVVLSVALGHSVVGHQLDVVLRADDGKVWLTEREQTPRVHSL
jgi:hypothetical protein